MKNNRTKNAAKNIVFGLLLKIIQIVIPFCIRTVMLYYLNAEYVGLNNLFTSILQVLNLAELGVGSAMVYCMYKPVIEKDETKICALMKLYKIYYRVIGFVILVTGILLCPFIPNLIKGTIPSGLNIYILYILNLMATVLSYWLFAYKNAVIQAHQRNDIISKITIIVNLIQYFLQFIAICVYKNYYMFIILNLLGQCAINVLISNASSKLYPNYNAVGTIKQIEKKEINKKVGDIFTAKLGMVIVNSVDSIVISAFLGLTSLAIYQNYYYILSAIIGIISVIFASCTSGMGNSIILESKEKNYNDLKKFTFIIAGIACICVCCFLNLFQDFMTLWVGNDLLLNFGCVVCFCIYFWVYEMNTLLTTYKDAAGIWNKDKFRPLVTALTNLILNLILVNYIGIYGIIISTILSFVVIGTPWLLRNLFTEVFKKNAKEYVIDLIKYAIVAVIMCLITFVICSFIKTNLLFAIIIKGFVSSIVSGLMWLIIFRNKKEMKASFKMIMRIIKRS